MPPFSAPAPAPAPLPGPALPADTASQRVPGTGPTTSRSPSRHASAPVGRAASAAPLLLGREPETEQILGVVEGRPGLPRALLVLGASGIGKTRLLRLAEDMAAAARARVLSTRGWEAETGQPFAALHQLLAPVRGELDALPWQQRQALRAVTGTAAHARRTDRTAVRLALAALVDRLAQAGPLLLAVDAVQDCDAASMDALFFMARRLSDPRATMLIAARGTTPPAGTPDDLAVLRLGPLAPHDAARLLDAQPGAPTGRTRLEVLREAAGNPLAIVELGRVTGRGDGPDGPGGEPWHTAGVRSLFDARVAALPKVTRRALLYAASAHCPEELPAVMAALGTGDLRVWAPAEAAGLVRLTCSRLEFTDPLLPAVVRLAHPMAARQQAHRDLAAAGGHHPVHRSWHLAAATVGPDASLAARLEEATDPALREGSCFDAARTAEEAARLTPSVPHGADRARRLATALALASAAGDPAWVRDLYADFTRTHRDPELQCVAACATSAALSLLSFQREAFGLLLDAWRRTPPRSAETALVMTAVATGVAHRSGLPEHHRQVHGMIRRAVRTARHTAGRHRTPKAPGNAPGAVSGGSGGSGVLAFLDGLVPEGHAALGQFPAVGALAAPRTPTARPERFRGTAAVVRLIAAASTAYHADEHDLCAEQYRQLREPLRSCGAVGLLAWTLPTHVDTLLGIGRWAEAEALIEEGVSYAAVHRLTRLETDLEALATTLRALRGASTPGPRCSGSSSAALSLDENRATHALMLRAEGLAALARGDAESSFRSFRSLFADDGSPLDPYLSPRCVAELAAAARRTGRQREVARILREVRVAQGPHPSTRMTLLMHHAAALLDETADPERHFRLALTDPEADTWPLERARARLHYAIWLRRHRRPLEARGQLTAVLEVAVRLGSSDLATSARGELRATGVADSPCAPAQALAELTPQQQQIVRLAAGGLSNREIGAQLFLSPRTVSTHLYKVYPKLGISRRHQLRDLLHER